MRRTPIQLEAVGRRAELLAELFLQDLSPFFVARNTDAKFGIDFFVGFRNSKGGVNLVAVEVKATERLARDRFRVRKQTYDLLANSNIPGLLLVVDVKHTRFFCREVAASETADDVEYVNVNVAEVTVAERAALGRKLAAKLPSDVPDFEEVAHVAIERLANDLIDSDDQLTSLVAETNASGFYPDEVSILSLGKLDLETVKFEFEASVHYAGDQHEDRGFAGNAIVARVWGSIAFNGEDWVATDERVEAEIDYPDDEVEDDD